MRIAIGQLWQESNTFNPIPTTRQDFDHFGIVRGSELVERMADTNELGGFIQALRRWPKQPEIVGLVCSPAWPGGKATAELFDWIRSGVGVGNRMDLDEAVLQGRFDLSIRENHDSLP